MSKKAEIDVDVERDEEEKRKGRLPKEELVEEETRARRERGAKGEPALEDFEKGEYHGLTPLQIKKIEDARYNDADSVTTVDGAGTQAEEQQRIMEKQEKEEKDRRAKEKAEWEKAEKDRQTKEKADRDEREKEASHGKVNKRT